MCSDDEVWGYGVLRARGLSRRVIQAQLAAGRLQRVRFGVYASENACDDVLAAARHGGVLACVSAARHRGLWTLDAPGVHVWPGADGHRHQHDDCRCVEHWTPGRPGRAFEQATLVDVLRQVYRCQGAESFFVALESALRHGHLRAGARRELARGLDAAGRELLAFARSDADSGLESLFRLRLRHLGARLRSQVRVSGVGRVDFLLDGRVIVELDGRLGHASPDERQKDLSRDATAAMWGYRTLRFSYAMVLHDWDLVESAVVAALA